MGLHEMNAQDAIEFIAGLPDGHDFHAMLVHETEHPRYPGGRKTVKDAIQERMGEAATGTSDGLARGPSDPYAEADAPQSDEPPHPEPGTRLLVTDAAGQTHDAVAVRVETRLVVATRSVPPVELFVRPGNGAEPMTYRLPD